MSQRSVGSEKSDRIKEDICNYFVPSLLAIYKPSSESLVFFNLWLISGFSKRFPYLSINDCDSNSYECF